MIKTKIDKMQFLVQTDDVSLVGSRIRSKTRALLLFKQKQKIWLMRAFVIALASHYKLQYYIHRVSSTTQCTARKEREKDIAEKRIYCICCMLLYVVVPHTYSNTQNSIALYSFYYYIQSKQLANTQNSITLSAIEGCFMYI